MVPLTPSTLRAGTEDLPPISAVTVTTAVPSTLPVLQPFAAAVQWNYNGLGMIAATPFARPALFGPRLIVTPSNGGVCHILGPSACLLTVTIVWGATRLGDDSACLSAALTVPVDLTLAWPSASASQYSIMMIDVAAGVYPDVTTFQVSFDVLCALLAS